MSARAVSQSETAPGPRPRGIARLLRLPGAWRLTWINGIGGRGTQTVPMLDQAKLESSAHLDSMRKFARRREVAEASAIAIYESECVKLAQRAKLHRFVGILAEKRAKAEIAKMRNERASAS